MRTAILLAIAPLLTPSALGQAVPQAISPSVAFSVHDEPLDGIGDSLNSFTGLVRTQSTRADRACQEFDVSAFVGLQIQSATLEGRVSVNNAQNNGVRTFDFLVYAGNGASDLSDYEITATVVGSGSYQPPADSSFDYSLDVTGQVQALLDNGTAFVGLRCEGTSNPNFPNLLSSSLSTLTITAAPGIGSAYCSPVVPNSSGTVGSIRAEGSDVRAANDVTLIASGVPASTFGIFLTSQTQGFTAGPGGSQGNLCLGGMIGRYSQPGQIQQADGSGSFSFALDLAQTPQPSALVNVTAGETWNYQAWHRDVVGGMATSNFTNGVSITYQ